MTANVHPTTGQEGQEKEQEGQEKEQEGQETILQSMKTKEAKLLAEFEESQRVTEQCKKNYVEHVTKMCEWKKRAAESEFDRQLKRVHATSATT